MIERTRTIFEEKIVSPISSVRKREASGQVKMKKETEHTKIPPNGEYSMTKESSAPELS